MNKIWIPVCLFGNNLVVGPKETILERQKIQNVIKSD